MHNIFTDRARAQFTLTSKNKDSIGRTIFRTCFYVHMLILRKQAQKIIQELKVPCVVAYILGQIQSEHFSARIFFA